MPADGSSNTAEEEAAEAMASRGESDTAAAQRAYRLLDAELTAAAATAVSHDGPPPTTASVATLSTLSRSAAGALLSWIRCSTAGNGLIVADGGKVATSDTVERRELWGKHAPRVLQLVKESGEDPSSDPELQQIFTEAVMYSVATQGVVEAIVSGKRK
ncbi:hypothetical protein Esi_0072_0002 [Ectocarpus siliculosus]|uniref:Uncharacterized protein n=1 Tax=Ectocarpus siliculosus TaxID=2880 RepID=D8LSB7_ECTSI|nr:hypothetical protein Esi_0072_0002 [Ectocarpus siliculosus]|eukprot:CBN75174.1 hypothetical protein Esi_0072_0002 [Ectocarpus siliculosus]